MLPAGANDMPSDQLSQVVQRLRKAALVRDGGGLTDGQLLACFATQRDEAAFEALVRRHGPMVLAVCRRVIGNLHDAEDAFQATFLILVRKAASLRSRELVGNWLYGVAYRTALKARAAAARQHTREKQVKDMPHPQAQPEAAWQDWQPLLDQELNRLPDKYRVPVVLCELEGRTRKEVARQLGIPQGTLSSRLATAKHMLARRLSRHGLTFSAAALASVLSANGASACVTAPLVAATTQVAMLVAAGKAAKAGVISAKVAALTEGGLKAMLLTKCKIATALLLAVGVIASGAGLLRYQTSAAERADSHKDRTATVRAKRGGTAEDADNKAKTETISVKTMPPVVVRTVPQAGSTAVDAAKTQEIRVSFSKDMMDKSWSWSQISDETFPKVTGKPRYDKDRRTCILPVKLDAGKTYVLWLNSEKFTNFKDADGKPAVPYLLVFETKP